MAYVSIPTYWKTIPQRYSLIGSKCKNCGTINFPPRDICIECGKKVERAPLRLKGQGKIYSHTIICAGGAPPEFSEQERLGGSFGVAVIELEEGPKIVAQMADCKPSELSIGMKVEAVFRRIYEDDDVIRYGVKFRPIKTEESSTKAKI
jgi:uncharacterized OB-fold protein